MRQIIAIGGGGFGRTTHENHIEQYILDQSPKSNPGILLFLLPVQSHLITLKIFIKSSTNLNVIPTILII